MDGIFSPTSFSSDDLWLFRTAVEKLSYKIGRSTNACIYRNLLSTIWNLGWLKEKDLNQGIGYNCRKKKNCLLFSIAPFSFIKSNENFHLSEGFMLICGYFKSLPQIIEQPRLEGMSQDDQVQSLMGKESLGDIIIE